MASGKARIKDKARSFYKRQDSTMPPDQQNKIIDAEEERNPGFLARIGAARDKDEDNRYRAAFSLTCRDLIGHASVRHGGWLEVDNAIDRLYEDTWNAVLSVMEEHGCCYSVVRAVFVNFFAEDIANELDPERQQDGSVCGPPCLGRD
ncbi:MAG: hypothetical protein ABSB82_08050 [Terriglobia bacterium]|jgi:hypothetical protein